MSSVAINIRRGDTLDLPLEFFTDSTETTPLDFTGSTLTVVDSTFPVAAAPTLSVVDASNGQLQLSWTDTQTDSLVTRRVYQLEIKQVQPSGAIRHHGPLVFVAVE